MTFKAQEETLFQAKIYCISGTEDDSVGSVMLYRRPFLTDEQWIKEIRKNLEEVIEHATHFCGSQD